MARPQSRATETAVLIVGAGPTGLTLAIELARRGIAFRLIDRDVRRAETSRAIGTQARTVEVFRIMGIPESALQPGVWPRALRLAERERTLARLPFAADPAAGPRLLSMDESDTERVLEERLTALGGGIEQSTELTTFRIDGDRVDATLSGPDGESQVVARFLVGADGVQSTVRREAGIGFAGERYPERFLLADIDIDWDLPHDEGHVWIGGDDLAAVIPLPGERRYRVIVPLSPDQSAKDFASEAEIAAAAEALLRVRSGMPLRVVGEPGWASAFRIQRRQAERYRVGPVFLAGDAAHVHSPVGGQGMNTGIQDAFNLGWKLALAARGLAAPGLLDTYETERHPIARNVLRGTDLATRLVLARHPLLESVREHVVPRLASLPPVRRSMLAAISQLDVGYRGSPISVNGDKASGGRGRLGRDAAIRPGDRVPDAHLVDSASGESIALFGLIASGWVLLLFLGANPAAERLAAVDGLVQQTRLMVGDDVQVRVMMRGSVGQEVAAKVLIDPAGALHRVFAQRQNLAALVRPDGYLGYRGRLDQTGDLAAYLARVFAMRLPGIRSDTSLAPSLPPAG